MAANPSFDVSTGADLQEVDNAVNQAVKEVGQRYDFGDSHCTIELDRTKAEIRLAADNEFRMDALLDILRTKLVKRGVPSEPPIGDPIPGAGTSVRRTIGIAQEFPGHRQEDCESDQDHGFKKVQSSIQGEEIRVTAPSKDELQQVIAFLRAGDFELELKFGNYRG
jgi:uncharacterized protein YajQ (UPF0234 family)